MGDFLLEKELHDNGTMDKVTNDIPRASQNNVLKSYLTMFSALTADRLVFNEEEF
jgi:hypothetical protein